MTALNYLIQEDRICLAMDTLVVSADKKIPIHYQTKFSILPHLNLVVAGTGRIDFIQEWFQCVNGSLNVKDIEGLDEISPDILRSEWSIIYDESCKSSTIYHFGYSQDKQEYTGFAYRSTNDFQSERLICSVGIKPEVTIPSAEGDQLPQLLVDIMPEQRRINEGLPASEKLGIGGDICFLVMKDKQISVAPVYRFESYDSDFDVMLRNTGSNSW